MCEPVRREGEASVCVCVCGRGGGGKRVSKNLSVRSTQHSDTRLKK